MNIGKSLQIQPRLRFHATWAAAMATTAVWLVGCSSQDKKMPTSNAGAPAPVLDEPVDGSATTDSTPTFAGTVETASGDVPTVKVRVYKGSEVSGAPLRRSQIIAGRDGKWSLEDGTPLAPGTYTAQAAQTDRAGDAGLSDAVTFTVDPPREVGDAPALIAAGDIADCGSTGDDKTAALLAKLTGEIQTIGDNAYPKGSTEDFRCFDASWGRFKSRIHPSLGDHEYDLGDAKPYFAYFGKAAGDPKKGYYSYDLGTWRIAVTNSVCHVVPGGCDAGSPQEEWLRQDLASNPRQCSLAVVGGPRFSSGEVHGSSARYEDLWKALYDNGVDVVLSGDDHVYERFAPQTPNGLSDVDHGIRQFTVGTGGYYLYKFGRTLPLSEERRAGTHGLLRLTLRDGSYDWRFHAVAGSDYTDTGSTNCH